MMFFSSTSSSGLCLAMIMLATTDAWFQSSFMPQHQVLLLRRVSSPVHRHHRSGSMLQMRIQWDPYTGQFIDTGDDPPEEIGVPPSRPPSASKATGIKSDEMKVSGGNVAKATAYLANKMANENAPEGAVVDQLMKELDQFTLENLLPGETATWPEITENMKGVLRNEQLVALENVRRNIDIARSQIVMVSTKESALAEAIEAALKARGGSAKSLIGEDIKPEQVKEASVLLFLPEGKEGAKFSFGGKPGGSMLEAHQVEALINAAAKGSNLRHVIYVSSLGSEKAGFQFSLDSMSGTLEKKKAVEQSIKRVSKFNGFNYSIMRVGNLGPLKGGEEGILLEPGDTLTGATSIPTAAQAVVQCLGVPSALNASFSLVNTKGPPPTDEDWSDNLLKLVGPELFRRRIKADVGDMRMSLRAWALQYMEGTRKLTTKVFAVRSPTGAKIYFLPTMNSLSGPGFREEKAIERARMKGDATPASRKPDRPILEGGLEVCVDDKPYPRVRIRRIAMEEGTIVKAMSERELLEGLKEEIEGVEKLAALGKRVTGGGGETTSR